MAEHNTNMNGNEHHSPIVSHASSAFHSTKQKSFLNDPVTKRNVSTSIPQENLNGNYDDFPLLQSMIKHEFTRTANLKQEGKLIMEYTRSNEGWIATLFVVKGRALDWMIFPWTISVLHALLYTLIQELWMDVKDRNMESWEIFFSFVLNSTLSFLLVFRLNRAAGRFWAARQYWGDIVAQIRSAVGGIIVHGDHNLVHRDNTIRWILAFTIATMELLRGSSKLPAGNFAGILSEVEIDELQRQPHPPLYAIDKARYHLKQLFLVHEQTSPSLAYAWTRQLDSLENQINVMVWSGGGMERIRATPLPIVYVSHLRTFVLLALFLYPWVFGPSWRWSTIPLVAIAGFAWLGIECAAAEVESPFKEKRVNSLDMNAYILGLIATTQQQLKTHADEGIRRSSEQKEWE